MAKHIMTDIECLGTGIKRDAVVVSVALIKFDLKGLDDWGSFGTAERMMYVELPCIPQGPAGRTIDFDTVRWWMEQSKEAQRPFRNPIHTTPSPEYQDAMLRQSLNSMDSFLTNHADPEKPPFLWAKPAHFDCPILMSLFKAFDIEPPIPWWNYRCMHTLQSICKSLDIQDSGYESMKGVAHNALDDAKQQVLELQGWFRQLKSLRSSGTLSRS